jgi:hypothetical protein
MRSSTSSGASVRKPAIASDGAPGARPRYRRDYYGAFLLDPDGNNVEVVNHNR